MRRTPRPRLANTSAARESRPGERATWLRQASLVFELRGIHKADLLHPIALCGGEYLNHGVVIHTAVGAQVDLRLRASLSFGTEIALELLPTGECRAVPHHSAVGVNLQVDNLRADGVRQRGRVRQIQFYRVRHEWQGNNEGHKQHEHDINQRSGIDVTYSVAVG